MVTFITEKEVDSLLSMEDAIHSVEASLQEQGLGEAINRPRNRVNIESTTLHVLPAAVPSVASMGLKAYTTGPLGGRFWIMLFGSDGALRAILEADRLGQVRTGAATGVATRHLSRPDSRTVGVIGSGYQARTQLEAVCAVRPIERIKAWSQTRENLEQFCEVMSEKLSIDVESSNDPRSVVQDADVVITMTKAQEPVLRGDWLTPGMHLNFAGSNQAANREVDEQAFSRAGLVVVDDLAQARMESGDLISAVEKGAIEWDDVTELGTILADGAPGREADEDITIFESHGIGLWDVAVAARVYELAEQEGVGTELPITAGPEPTVE